MRKYISVTLIIFFSAVLNSSGQTLDTAKDSSTTWQLLKYDANKTFKGITHAVTRPLHWQGDDFEKFGSIILGSVILSVSDQPSSDILRRNEKHVPMVIKEFGLHFGQPHNYLMLNAGIYGFGLLTKNEAVRKTSVLILSSAMTAGYIQIFARTAIGRARPLTEDGPYTFKPFKGGDKYFSFPSGHAVLSMTMAHAIAKQFDNTWTKIGIYTVGSIPGFTRLLNGKHWITDVAFGTVLSIVVVDSIDKFLFDSQAYTYPKKEKRISWNLSFGGNRIGITGTF